MKRLFFVPVLALFLAPLKHNLIELAGPATGRRSICFTEIAYDEDGKISVL